MVAAKSVPPPTFVSAATSTDGATVTITFSKAMADPSGKHAQFTVTVAGSGDAVTAAALNAATTKIDLTLTTAVTSGQTVTVAYTAGTVVAADTGVLASFTAQAVTNNAVAPYQDWASHPDSPGLTADYPYQFVSDVSGSTMYELYLCDNPFYFHSSTYLNSASGSHWKVYMHGSGDWYYVTGGTSNGTPFAEYNSLKEANSDIFTNSSKTAVYFAKTTT